MYASGVELLPGEKHFDYEYMDGIGLLCCNMQAIHIALSQLTVGIRKCSMFFAPCKLLL